MRTYELAIVADPRLSEDEFVALVDETKQLVSNRGGELVREESWGKRKLAYPIENLTEGRYTFLYLQMEPANSGLIPEVELRLKQNDKVLRFITVRTDEDLKRAANRAKPGQPVRTIHGEPTIDHSGGPAGGPARSPAGPAIDPSVSAAVDRMLESVREAGEEE
jgi:small subunit ribosomal protein S6